MIKISQNQEDRVMGRANTSATYHQPRIKKMTFLLHAHTTSSSSGTLSFAAALSSTRPADCQSSCSFIENTLILRWSANPNTCEITSKSFYEKLYVFFMTTESTFCFSIFNCFGNNNDAFILYYNLY